MICWTQEIMTPDILNVSMALISFKQMITEVTRMTSDTRTLIDLKNSYGSKI